MRPPCNGSGTGSPGYRSRAWCKERTCSSSCGSFFGHNGKCSVHLPRGSSAPRPGMLVWITALWPRVATKVSTCGRGSPVVRANASRMRSRRRGLRAERRACTAKLGVNHGNSPSAWPSSLSLLRRSLGPIVSRGRSSSSATAWLQSKECGYNAHASGASQPSFASILRYERKRRSPRRGCVALASHAPGERRTNSPRRPRFFL